MSQRSRIPLVNNAAWMARSRDHGLGCRAGTGQLIAQQVHQLLADVVQLERRRVQQVADVEQVAGRGLGRELVALLGEPLVDAGGGALVERVDALELAAGQQPGARGAEGGEVDGRQIGPDRLGRHRRPGGAVPLSAL
jgi:hypothetical protein